LTLRFAQGDYGNFIVFAVFEAVEDSPSRKLSLGLSSLSGMLLQQRLGLRFQF